ncbi:MAG: hypothetical protein ACYCWW_16265 [Deltaproteobacteria bacterium]
MSNNSNTGANVNPNAQKNAPRGLFLALTLFKQGVDSVIPSRSSILVAGVSITQSALSSELASDLALFQAVIDARNKLEAALAARVAAVPGLKVRYANLRKAIESQLQADTAVLAQFGIRPQKPKAKLTAEALAVKKAKAKLTREARGTLGKKRKLLIQTVGTPTVTITQQGVQVTPPAGSSGNEAGTGSTPSQPKGSGSGTTSGA